MPAFGNNVDFNKWQLLNMRLQNLASDPSSPVLGQAYYNTVSNTVRVYTGSVFVDLASGTVADATTSSKGIVQLAGDLAGTATAPVVANNAITAAKIANATITDVQVAAANKDGTAGTASLRTLGTGAQQAMAGNTRLDTIAAPTGAVAFNSQRITGLADPTGAQDGATKNYVDNAIAGLDAKASVQAATVGTETFTIASGAVTQIAGTSIDGVSPAVGQRILIKDAPVSTGVGSPNSNNPANGIYTVTNNTTNLTVARAADMDSWAEVPSSFTWVEQGTANLDSAWLVTADQGGTLNTTGIQWSQFSASTTVAAGNGLQKVGNTLSVKLPGGSGLTADGTGTYISAAGVTNAMLAGSIDLTTKVTNALPIANGGTSQTTAKAARETGLGAGGYYSNGATHGAGATITITQATHGLRSSRAIHVQVQDATTGNVEFPDATVASNGDVTITYGASQSANSKLVTLVG